MSIKEYIPGLGGDDDTEEKIENDDTPLDKSIKNQEESAELIGDIVEKAKDEGRENLDNEINDVLKECQEERETSNEDYEKVQKPEKQAKEVLERIKDVNGDEAEYLQDMVDVEKGMGLGTLKQSLSFAEEGYEALLGLKDEKPKMVNDYEDILKQGAEIFRKVNNNYKDVLTEIKEMSSRQAETNDSKKSKFVGEQKGGEDGSLSDPFSELTTGNENDNDDGVNLTQGLDDLNYESDNKDRGWSAVKDGDSNDNDIHNRVQKAVEAESQYSENLEEVVEGIVGRKQEIREAAEGYQEKVENKLQKAHEKLQEEYEETMSDEYAEKLFKINKISKKYRGETFFDDDELENRFGDEDFGLEDFKDNYEPDDLQGYEENQ